jgi:hypothetical protein
VVAGLLGALVLDAAVWSWWELTTDEGYEACLSEPASCVGQRHVLPLQRVYAVTATTAEVGRPQRRVHVRGDLDGVRVGEELSLSGTFAADGRLELEGVERHPLRPQKRWLGVVGAVALLLLLPLVFTVRRGRVVPRRSARG